MVTGKNKDGQLKAIHAKNIGMSAREYQNRYGYGLARSIDETHRAEEGSIRGPNLAAAVERAERQDRSELVYKGIRYRKQGPGEWEPSYML